MPLITGQRAPDLAFFDLEATGLEFVKQIGPWGRGLLVPWHEIIELGWVRVRQRDARAGVDWEIRDEANYRIAPQRLSVANQKSLEVVGYVERARKGEWANAVPLREALWQFLTHCEGSHLIGVNSSFDVKFLECAFAEAGIPRREFEKRFHHRVLEVNSVAMGKLLTPGVPYAPWTFGSGKLSEYLGIEKEQEPHCAVNGARHGFAVYRALMDLDAKTLRALQRRIKGETTLREG